MKIRVSDLTHEGLDLDESLSLEALNERMGGARGNDVVFTSAPHVRIGIRKMEGGAEVSGEITSQYTQPCSRCADDLKRDLKVPVHLILQEIGSREKKKASSREEPYESLDDVGITFFEGDHIELEDMLQEQIILSLDTVYRPPCTASGDCTICGKNPEGMFSQERSKDSVKLGDLLSIAAQKGKATS